MSTNEKRNHYRMVYKSDHLGVADLEDLIEQGKTDLIFTIKDVKQELNATVAGKKGDFNIAYFVENIKPLVLNATNSKIVRSFAPAKSPYVNDWNNIIVQLYIDSSVKMKGDVVGGVRIRPLQPVINQKPFFTKENFEKAKKAGATVEKVKEIYQITSEVESAYKTYLAE